MSERRSLTARIALDLALYLICAILSGLILPAIERRIATDWPSPAMVVTLSSTLAWFPVVCLILVLSDLYEVPKNRTPFQTLRGMLLAFVLSGVLYLVASFVIIPLGPARKATALTHVIALLALWGARILAPELYGQPGRKKRMLLIGAHTFAVRALQRHVHENPDDFELVGVIDDFKRGLYFENINLRHFGGRDQIPFALQNHEIDTLVVLNDQAEYAASVMAALKQFPQIREIYVRAQIPLFMAQDIDILFLQEVPLLKLYSGVDGRKAYPLRGMLDRVLAAIALVLTSPFFLIMPILIRMESRGPAFYRQLRLGIGNEPFWIFKFRSMGADAERASGAVLAQKNDPRVTRIGKFMRATRIDEIPQLINVLRGEMSMIGPRPERPEFQNVYLETIPWYSLRALCRPGITGLAQVNGDYHTSAQRKLLYDVTYLANLSPLLDLRILVATLVTVVSKRGH